MEQNLFSTHRLHDGSELCDSSEIHLMDIPKTCDTLAQDDLIVNNTISQLDDDTNVIQFLVKDEYFINMQSYIINHINF